MRVIVGVGGGIAAYKAAELTRLLQSAGHHVQVVMTDAARQFIQPLTFAALTGERVITGLFTNPENAAETLSSAVEHIAVARDHDVLVVAPATANVLAKFACGLADDFLSTLYLAFTGPVILAPAMNTAMWQHPATEAHVETLVARGCRVVEPGEGLLACGEVGAGRLADPAIIVNAVNALQMRDFAGETILITAGPTQEPIDPVRYITNRSSGKMGYALATAASERGAKVILISGPVDLKPPAGVDVVKVKTAVDMRAAVFEKLAHATVVIKAAAVADYYAPTIPQHKTKKSDADYTITLARTCDILAELGRDKGDRFLVGFAAETENLLEEAKRKLAVKNCDMVVGNLVGGSTTGFDADANEVEIVTRSGTTLHAGPAPKRQIADIILNEIMKEKTAQR